ncbi:wall-associated receptor kinase galacturonan-binding protein [Trifolium medium]|uniref:Wall-associated receptor kinase galacturonan-binding protein n=1 Tax=Trifolium medium TaxID=97028 RepID=A0A392LWN4_9FABA|nr:wall-associated receptor kinase galacturonan-binding protein [Trifolium medium]
MVVVLVLHHHQACDATTNSSNNNQTYCPISSCGKITNIRQPFRLKNDPSACGDPKYELSCENNVTTLTLFSGKYYVKSINYEDYTVQVVDPGIEAGNCSSIPRYFLTTSNFTSESYYIYNDYNGDPYLIIMIIYLKCSKEVKDDPGYVDTAPCRINSDSKSYVYAFAGANYWESNKYLTVGRLKDYCKVKLVTMSSFDFPGVRDDIPNRPLSYEQIHGMLLYGFQLSWINGGCRDSCGDNQGCSFNQTTADFECYELTNDCCYYPLGTYVAKRCDLLSKQLIIAQVLASSDSSPLAIAVAGDRTVVLPTKFSVNHTETTNNW